MRKRRGNSAELIGALFVLLVGWVSLVGVYPAWSEDAETTKQEAYGASSAMRDDLPALSGSSTLRDYLVYAALNNAGLKAAYYQWQAVREEAPQVTALPDPKFSYAYFIREVETRVGAQNQSIGLSQTFPWFGKLKLRGKGALHRAAAAEQRYEAAKLDLFFRVKEAFAEYYYLGRTLAITEENIQLLTYLEGVARTQYKGGRDVYGAVIQIQVELGKLEDRLRSLQDLREPTVARLNAALNRPLNHSLPWPKALPEGQLAGSDRALLEALRENHPRLKELDHAIGEQQIARQLARKNFYPDLTFALDFIDTNEATMSGIKESGKDPIVASISMNLPIWRGKYRAAERAAEARTQAAEQQKAEQANRLEVALIRALYDYRNAERKIDLYHDTLIPKAEQSLAVARQALSAGKADSLQLVDAQRSLLEFQLSYERALADRMQSLAKIESLAGGASVEDLLDPPRQVVEEEKELQ